MGCGCGKKGKRGKAIDMSKTNNYDFAGDPDFILVQSVGRDMKKLRSYTLPMVEMYRLYEMNTYGFVAKHMQLWMLETDFEHYDTHPSLGAKLVRVEPEVVKPVAEAVIDEVGVELVIENEPEAELIQKIVVPEGEQQMPEPEEDLTKIKGIGKATEKKLKAAGYKTVESLANLPFEEYSEMLPMASEETYTKLLISVKEVLDN